MITSIFGWLSGHPVFLKILLISTSTAATLFLTYRIIFPFRSRWKDLRDKGYEDRKTKKVFALKLRRNLILFKFNRSKTESDFLNDISFFSEKFNEDYFEVIKIEWQRYLGLDTWIMLRVPNFKDRESIKISNDPWVINLGIDSSKKIFNINVKEYSEIFISGLSGSGKSVLLSNILLHCKENKILNYTLTSKIFDFTNFENIIDTSENYDEAFEIINRIEQIFFERSKALTENKLTHVEKLDLDPIFLCIDEAHSTLKKNKDLEKNIMIDKIEKFIRQGRALGIITVPVSQHAQKNELDISIREGALIIGKTDSRAISEELLGNDMGTRPWLRNGLMIAKTKYETKVIKGGWID